MVKAISIEWLLFRARLSRTRDEIARKLAWKLPHRLVMWCGYRILANATQGEWSGENPTLVKMWDALERWGE